VRIRQKSRVENTFFCRKTPNFKILNNHYVSCCGVVVVFVRLHANEGNNQSLCLRNPLDKGEGGIKDTFDVGY